MKEFLRKMFVNKYVGYALISLPIVVIAAGLGASVGWFKILIIIGFVFAMFGCFSIGFKLIDK